ncbi:MAG: VOC family protein [Candidatus Acidiferrum sp.]
MSEESKTVSNVKQAVPFFMVSDMEESLRFYADGLGFQMIKKWIDEGKLRWCWLQIGEAALMPQEFRKEGTIRGHPAAKWEKVYRSVSCAMTHWPSVAKPRPGELKFEEIRS